MIFILQLHCYEETDTEFLDCPKEFSWEEIIKFINDATNYTVLAVVPEIYPFITKEAVWVKLEDIISLYDLFQNNEKIEGKESFSICKIGYQTFYGYFREELLQYKNIISYILNQWEIKGFQTAQTIDFIRKEIQ